MAHGPHTDHVPGARHEPVPLDPEHDINARSVTWWFIGGGLAIFLSLWALVPIFMRVLEVERHSKVDTAPLTELNDVKAEEMEFLRGGNPQKKNIDDVVKQLRKN
jgi:hypothetical protein